MVKVAVVTGGNRGIGFHIVRGLCKEFDGDIYLTDRAEDAHYSLSDLSVDPKVDDSPQNSRKWYPNFSLSEIIYKMYTARDAGRGQAAVETLEKEGFSPQFHQLDVTDEDSIKTLVDFINDQYGGWDLLVNNAGMVVKVADPMTRGEEVDYTFGINYFGCINVCNHFLQTIRDGARMVHVSSGSGSIAYQSCTEEMQRAIRSVSSLDQVTELMLTYTSTTKFGMGGILGWPDSDEDFGIGLRPWAYGVSKIGMTLHALMLQRELDKTYKDVIINACSPGYCATDGTDHKGPKPAAEGAAVVLSLALLPPNAEFPRGKYKEEEMVLEDWYDIVLTPFDQVKKK